MSGIEAGADARGFVFYEKSPRYISPLEAKKIISKLPPFVEKVALFVNQDANSMNTMCKESGATLIQLHFDVDDATIDQLEFPYIRVIRTKTPDDIQKYSDSYRLVDAYCEAYGGVGKRLNLEWFEGVDCSKIILAGGLTPLNVNATQAYNFYGVDVSSGVEISHGKKDPKKIKDFIKNAQ